MGYTWAQGPPLTQLAVFYAELVTEACTMYLFLSSICFSSMSMTNSGREVHVTELFDHGTYSTTVLPFPVRKKNWLLQTLE
jgi:hypothetical protein